MRNNEILMPALSPTMEEGTLAKWLVKVGDKISSGDLIAEIETDKATMEIEAVEEGFISKLIVEDQTQLPVTHLFFNSVGIIHETGRESPDEDCQVFPLDFCLGSLESA